MLEITPTAASAIREMIEISGAEGMRVALGPSDSPNGSVPSAGVIIAPASGPVEDDETVQHGGVAVFVDSAVAPLVEDKVLDVELTDDRLRFTFTDRTRG